MMKKISVFALLLCAVSALWAQTIPTVSPSVDEARLRVVGQNMHNYFLNLSNSFSECSTQAQLDQKTQKIASVFTQLDADVYAMCELEVSDTAVGYIVAAMNAQVGQTRYAYVHDGLEDAYSNGATKVGFIYKLSTVRPLSQRSTSSSNSDKSTYGRRMRWIGWEELCSGEKFVVSMNHFKAKDSSADRGEGQRMTNAQNLYNAMQTMRRTDPDILVMGDLNCPTEEAPIQYLINTAGLEEQLQRFDAAAYSYRYQGQTQLIDHAMANATCAEQVVGAGFCHLATGYHSLRFSDHDLYVVGLNLGDYEPTAVEEVQSSKFKVQSAKCIVNGQLLIIRGDRMYTLTGLPL